LSAELVLVVTHRGDHFTVDRVAAALTRRGARPVRIDTDRFPAELRLSFTIGARGAAHHLRDGAVAIDAADVRATWIRRIEPPRWPDELDPQFRAGAASQAGRALDGLLAALADRRVVDPPAATAAAENKLHQLQLAHAAGLRVPETLVCNDPDQARAFYRAHDGAVVTKLLRPLSRSMGRAPVFMYTTAVTAADLDDLDTLVWAPMIFQRRIAKRCELRAIYVGGRFFTGGIDAAATARGQVDWRRAEVGEARWVEADLPESTAAAARRLMDALGLTTGAFDFIRTPDGDDVFLEVNPSGEWGMLERDLGLPISEALAELLLTPP
jgi:glutathione synthase/RimK-type ligase-like ATP-grasp enzyme